MNQTNDMSNQQLEPISYSESTLQSQNLSAENYQLFSDTVKWQLKKLEKGKMQFYAEVQIPYSMEQVWQVLTTYEDLPEFMINLQQIRRLDSPNGNIRLEKIFMKKFMGIKFQGRLVSDIVEDYPHKICENLVEGDFQSYIGYWRLNPWISSENKTGTNLIYDLLVLPKRIYPLPLVEHFLSKDVPNDILSVYQRVEALFGVKK